MPEGFDRLAYLAETDRQLNLPPGFSAAQIKVESNFNPNAVSPVGAVGLAQVMPNTLSSLNKREGGRNLDPRNEKDALQMHRELMKENLGRFGNPDDAARAYNGGWTPSRWTNPETASYVKKIRAAMGGSAVSPTNQAGTDLSAFASDPNMAPLIAQAKADGFSDSEIASRLTAAVQSGAFKPQAQSSSLNMDAVGKSIASMATNNMSNAQIVGKLANDPTVGPLVLQATRDGFSDDDIVSRLGGQAFAPIAQARAKIAGQGALTNAGQAAVNAVEEVGAGAQQIGARVTGDDARLKALQQEQIARQQNPENQALNNTTAGKVGKYGTLAVPSVLAGVATGGASIPAQIAVQGAVGSAQDWQNFLNQETSSLEGTPLEHYKGVTKARAAEMRAQGIYTVEALAELSDATAQRFGFAAAKEKAIQWIANTKEEAIAQKSAETAQAMEEMQRRNDEMAAMMAIMKTQLDGMSSKKKAKAEAEEDDAE